MKLCTKCKKSKDLIEFNKDSKYSSGFTSWCKECKKEQNRLKKYGLGWTKNNPARSKEIKDKYVGGNLDKVRNSKSKWAKANSKRILAKTRKYQASKLHATPSWLTEEQILEMVNIYKNCPKGYHVDHKVPLQGREVTGLHVPWNLQYLKASDNLRKSNKVA